MANHNKGYWWFWDIYGCRVVFESLLCLFPNCLWKFAHEFTIVKVIELSGFRVFVMYIYKKKREMCL